MFHCLQVSLDACVHILYRINKRSYICKIVGRSLSAEKHRMTVEIYRRSGKEKVHLPMKVRLGSPGRRAKRKLMSVTCLFIY